MLCSLNLKAGMAQRDWLNLLFDMMTVRGAAAGILRTDADLATGMYAICHK